MRKIIASFLLATCICNAQATPEDIGPSSYEVQMLPASPMMADLGKHGNVPINKYNGTANINIPIHNINLDGLSIPLVLRYNTGGIRVNQDATWVGLGWNLSEGITITREINGFDDLRDDDYSETISPNTTGHDNIGWIYTSNYLNEDLRISGDDLLNMDHKHWMNNNPLDLEPDLFSLNTPNGSCKFYLPKITNSTILTGKVVNNVNFKILYDSENFVFKVTDPDGFTYFFNAYELSSGYSSWDAPTAQSREDAIFGVTSWSTNQTKYTITSWRPTKIESPMGRNLNFSYQQGLHYSYPSYSESYKFPVYSSQNHNDGWYAPKEFIISGPNSVSVSINAFHSLYLTGISGDFGQIEFNLGDERLDLFSTEAFHELAGMVWNPTIFPNTFSAKRLNAVTVIDHLGNQVKNAVFDYGYFNEDDIDHLVKEKFLRLKLNNVTLNDQKYEFSYFECDFLPPKDSKAIDFWGFYNGAESNQHTIPSFNRFYFANPSPQNGEKGHEQFYKFIGANRKSDAYFAQYGLLDKVKYPTKGLTEYVYEGNTVQLKKVFYSVTQLPAPLGKASSLSSSESYNFGYQYLKLQNDPTYSLYEQQSFQPGEYEDFEVGGLRVAEIIDYDNVGNRVGHREFEYDLPTGNMEQTHSSGKLMDDLVFHSKGLGSTWEYTPETYTEGDGSNYARIHSDNMIRTSPSASGSHIGYSRVIERRVNEVGGNTGYIETQFKNNPNQRITRDIACTPQFWGVKGDFGCQIDYECWDDIHSCSDYAEQGYLYDNVFYGRVYINGALPETFEHLNGRVEKEITFNAQGAKVSENHYDYNEITRSGNVTKHYPIMNWYQTNSSFPIGNPYEVLNGDAFGINKEYKLAEIVAINYFEEGIVQNTTNYYYGDHNQLTKVVSKNSKGKIQTTKAYYPQDLMDDPAMQKLVDHNRTRIKIKSEVLEGTEIEPEKDFLLSQRTTFDNELNSTGIVLPEKVMTKKGKLVDSPEETRQIYDKYDAYGNLLQYHTEEGPPISFIWGYDHQYVVAEVKNATYSDIESILGEDFELGAEGLPQAKETSLRNGLPEAMLTTYRYKPLIGISETTDPRENTTYYFYDDFNRLEKVADNDLNLIQDYDYNYAQDDSNLGCTDLPDIVLPPLVISEGTTDRGANYFTFRIIASGGTGVYTYEWYRGIGSSDTDFEDVVASNTSELVLDVDCDQIQYAKVVVHSGNQQAEAVYINGNNPCLEGENPGNNN